MTRRAGRHCTAPTVCVPRAHRNRDWKAEAAKAKADKAAADKAAADKAAADKAAADKAAADKAAADKAAADAMSDSMGEAVYEAARDGNEAELTRLIGLGGSVNWHDPDVRRRMCLAWAPASSSLLLLRSPPRHRHGARPTRRHSPQLAARRRWLCRRPAAPPRRAWHTRPRRMARAASPRARPRSSRVLWHSMTPRVCFMCPARIHSSRDGLMLRARRVRPTPPRVRGDRGQRHECKPRACPPPSTCHGSASM
jgi:hypothetical protein